MSWWEVTCLWFGIFLILEAHDASKSGESKKEFLWYCVSYTLLYVVLGE